MDVIFKYYLFRSHIRESVTSSKKDNKLLKFNLSVFYIVFVGLTKGSLTFEHVSSIEKRGEFIPTKIKIIKYKNK